MNWATDFRHGGSGGFSVGSTMKLFAVCRHRGIPVLTVINKWDRPGKDALELMDEITERTGLTPTPLTWPVGIWLRSREVARA